jgi:hypothetical protein
MLGKIVSKETTGCRTQVPYLGDICSVLSDLRVASNCGSCVTVVVNRKQISRLL